MKKTFKIVMLQSEKVNEKGDICLFPYGFNIAGKADLGYPVQHLYIIDDSEIKEGDWSIHKGNPPVQTTISNMKFICNDCKKIVATTDKLLIEESRLMRECFPLQIHLIPESFIQAYIKAYNEGKPITEIDLEMDIIKNENYTGNSDSLISGYKIKTRPDNTVIVHQSKMYTRAEVIAFAKKYAARCQAPIQSTKWIDENL